MFYKTMVQRYCKSIAIANNSSFFHTIFIIMREDGADIPPKGVSFSDFICSFAM
jgi:hypothetical protein